MDNRSYHIIKRFTHESNTTIQEVKWLDVPDDSPKHLKYQWFLIKHPFPPLPLSFLSRDCNMRVFKEGVAFLHPAYIIFNGEFYDINTPRLPFVHTIDFYNGVT